MKDIHKLIKLFEQYSHGQNYSAAFSDMLDHVLLTLKFYETEDEQTIALNQLARYKKKDEHIAVLIEIGELSEGFEDPLGELYQQLISKGQHGQFFTPSPVAELIASTVITKEMQPGKTVLDPACGSGRMLLAAASINRHLHFYGADIDGICCKMSVINMLLNSLTGEIAHMDSLSNEFHCGYKINTVLRSGYHFPYYQEFTDPNESYIWSCAKEKDTNKKFDVTFEPIKSDLMSKGVQGSLFD